MKRRSVALGTCMLALALAGALLAGCSSVGGQSYPSKPIEFVVHTNPGDAIYTFADNASRILTSKKIVTQPMNIVVKSGGSSATAYSYVAGKKVDPYYLLSIQPSALTTPMTQNLEITYKQFTPIANMIGEENVIAVKADSPIKSMKDLVAAAKKEDKSVSMGGTTLGAADSIVTYMIEKEAGVKFNFVSFKSAGESVVAVLGGNVDAVSCNPSEIVGQMQAGTARVLGVASEKQSAFLPNVPTMKEQGLNIVFSSFRGVVMAGDVPADAVKFWQNAFAKLRDDSEWKDTLKTSTSIDQYLDTASFKPYLEEREKFYRQVLTDMGVIK